jgi:xylose isomerase
MKFSVILGNLSNTCDRFLSSGYKEQPSKEEMFRQAASIEGVSGVELVGTWDITAANVEEVRGHLEASGLECVSVIPDHFAQKKWGLGAFTSRDPKVRAEAVAVTKEMMDAAAELGCGLVNLWPGQDGYDYPFQGLFDQARDWLVEGIRDCALHREDVRLSLEYKLKEPRTHSYVARAADACMLAEDTSCPTVGVTIDTGHAMMAQENLAESAAMLMKRGRLFHLHFNDNYGHWDDDMIVGSVHFAGYVELLYWLKRLGYEGWLSMDQYPYREDARRAIQESVTWLSRLAERIDEFGTERLDSLVRDGDATVASAVLRELVGLV